MGKYKIEKGVPTPPSVLGRPTIYPFHEMQVGDSFVAPVEERRRITAASKSAGTRHGLKFTTRTDGDSIRVWRIK